MFEFLSGILGEKKQPKEQPRDPVDRLFNQYVDGRVTDSQLVVALGEDRIEEFCRYYATERNRLVSGSDRRIQFRVNQLDSLTESHGLKLRKKFGQATGATVIERLN